MTAFGRRCLVVLFALSLCALPARADKKNPVEKLAADAADAYRSGDYRRATELLERAYKLERVSALLYNLAKAYEKLGDTERAAELYARYVAAEDADPRLKSKAEARVAALREPVAAGNRKPPPSETPRPRQQPSDEPPQNPPPRNDAVVQRPVEPPVAKPDPDAPRREAEQSRRRNRGVGLGLVALGACTLGAAIGLSVNALMLNNQFKASTDEIDKKIALTNAVPQALAADILYGVTVAAVGISIYFIYKGFKPEPKALSLLPSAGPRGGGLVLEGVF
jgi:tetratricopeptide (TPR) repeat protein